MMPSTWVSRWLMEEVEEGGRRLQMVWVVKKYDGHYHFLLLLSPLSHHHLRSERSLSAVAFSPLRL